jgi:hypothetical protein
MRTDSDTSKIVEVRCSLKRPARQRSQTAAPDPTALPIVDALELRAKLPRITHTVARALMFEHAIANARPPTLPIWPGSRRRHANASAK